MARRSLTRPVAPTVPPDGDRIAELEAKVAALTDALSARDEFIATVAHELRNPISPIFFQLAILREKARARPDAAWVLPNLDSFSVRLERFLESLDRLLDVSRLAARGVTLMLQEGDFAAFVADACAKFDHQIELAGSTLTVESTEPIWGRWDRLRVEQITNNLVSNAIRYGAGKPITVRVSGDAVEVRLTVRDQGIGISVEDQLRIFERFERGSSERTAGFGIGLWVVHQLCRAMGGSVTVSSSRGNGATFEVVLPRRNEP